MRYSKSGLEHILFQSDKIQNNIIPKMRVLFSECISYHFCTSGVLTLGASPSVYPSARGRDYTKAEYHKVCTSWGNVGKSLITFIIAKEKPYGVELIDCYFIYSFVFDVCF